MPRIEAYLARNRKFESISLQRRVACEPEDEIDHGRASCASRRERAEPRRPLRRPYPSQPTAHCHDIAIVCLLILDDGDLGRERALDIHDICWAWKALLSSVSFQLIAPGGT